MTGILFQAGIIFFICFAGEAASLLLPFTFSAGILSMLILFMLLLLRILKTTHIEQVSDFLLKHMAFFFIPAGVSILTNYHLLRNIIIQFLFICAISTVVTFLAASATVNVVITLQCKCRLRKKTGEEK